MTDRQKHPIDPAGFFLLASLIIGILYCIAIPYGAGFDEERHLIRIYYLSENHFLPNFPRPVLYEEVISLSYQRRLVQSPAFDMFSPENFGRRFSRSEEHTRYGVSTQSIYSPIIFLPQALIGRALWWKFDFPILPTIILQKIAGLLIYIAGAYVAIHAVPYGKWIFAMLALSPAALYQAATLNADGFTTAVSFAFIGSVIAVYVNGHSGIRPGSVWLLALLSAVLGVAKPGAIVLLPLLLILWHQPFPSRKWIFLLFAGVLLAVFASVGWWVLASQGTAFSQSGSQSIARQSSLILSDPVGFIKPLVQGIILTFPDQIQGWIASYGYGAGTVPGPVYFFWVLCLLAAFLTDAPSVQIPRSIRIFLVALFCFCCLAMYSIAFAANYATGGVLALVKQGRYYIPFSPLFFLAISGLILIRENMHTWMLSIAIAAFLLTIAWFSFGIYTTYYTYCGYEAYLGAPCVLPIYKNLEKENAPVIAINAGDHINQTFINQCGELESVGVYVESVPASGDGILRFSLFDNEQQLLASRDFPTREIAAGDYLNLSVDLPPGYQNKKFDIALEALDLPLAETFRFIVKSGDYYPGQLITSEGTTGEDMIIHYVCTTP